MGNQSREPEGGDGTEHLGHEGLSDKMQEEEQRRRDKALEEWRKDMTPEDIERAKEIARRYREKIEESKKP